MRAIKYEGNQIREKRQKVCCCCIVLLQVLLYVRFAFLTLWQGHVLIVAMVSGVVVRSTVFCRVVFMSRIVTPHLFSVELPLFPP